MASLGQSSHNLLKHGLAEAESLVFSVKVLYTTLVATTVATITPSGCGAVDSALGLGPRGRRFEPFHPDHERFSEFLDRSTSKLYGGFSFITDIKLSFARRFNTTSR